MCEDAGYELPTSEDTAEWADHIGATFAVLADTEGEVCPAWDYAEGVTTVYVLAPGGVLSTRHDSTDSEVVDVVRDEVGALLSSTP